MKTTILELACVGNAAQSYIHAQCWVHWYEIVPDPQANKVEAISHSVPMKDFRREKRINYCRFEVPEAVICSYYRHVQTKPDVHERKWFRMDESQFTELSGDASGINFAEVFLADYIRLGYSCVVRSG